MTTNINTAITEANRYTRALKMKVEGYTFAPATMDCYDVYKPGNTVMPDYTVDLYRNTCDCADAQKGNTCKHQYFVQIELEDAANMEAQCAEYDKQQEEEEGGSELTRFRALLLAELTDAENKAITLHNEPFNQKSALQSWLNKANRVKTALHQMDETLLKVQVGLLAL